MKSRGAPRASLRLAFLSLTLCALPGCRTVVIEQQDEDEAIMPNALHIALQDGFGGAAVVIRVNGKEVYSRDDVSTDQKIGRADTLELPLGEGLIKLDVAVDNLESGIDLDLDTSIYLAISILERRIRFKLSSRPFGYL